MKPEFESIFLGLREILQKHSDRLSVTADTPERYCLEAGVQPRLKTLPQPRSGKEWTMTKQQRIPVAWIQIGKSYVSFHFMPVYMFPKLRQGLSEKLRARMQGKSCFNFTVADTALFKELEKLAEEGFAACRKAGFGP